eukprot:4559055-Ditylum_brightwellii.AAC.1
MVSAQTGIDNSGHPTEVDSGRTQRKNDPGLKKACSLVQDILEQITLGDSPPVNEDGAQGDSLFGKSGDFNDVPTSFKSVP